ncbi:MAG: sensor histidine kinase [Chloroflexi bacterium]|nr:sensor histidine kinase [Chloroflexota bacterium]
MHASSVGRWRFLLLVRSPAQRRLLRWVTILGPATFVAVFEWLRHTFLDHYIGVWEGSLIVLVVIFGGAFLFSRAVFATIEAIERELIEQSRTVAVLEERDRIAREMHDSLGQVLGYVNTKSQAVAEFLAAGHLGEARKQIEQLSQASSQVYADVRESIMGLRVGISGERDLGHVLKEYLDSFSEQNQIEAKLVVPEGGNIKFPQEQELQIIRIIQEALSNVRKHANASQAIVRFAIEPSSVMINVEDNGRGFDPMRIARGSRPHFGLQTMKERAEAIGAELLLDSKPGHGTKVSLRVPKYAGKAT